MTWRRAIAMAAGAALGIAGVVALLLAADGDSGSSGGPAAPSESRQQPPWGFVGPWVDYCHRPLATPPYYAAEPVFEGQRCRSGSTRFTTAEQIALAARAGATIGRMAVHWGAVEPRPPTVSGGRPVHAYNWAPALRLYGQMLAAGIRPIVVATGAPVWARSAGWDRPGACAALHGKSCSYPPSPRYLADWRAFVGELTRRLPRMLALEVWNEPNLPRFFAPQPSLALYSRLLRAASRAVKEGGVPVTVLAGGLSSSGSAADGGIADARFLAGVYRLAGEASFDGIAAHPYPQGRRWVEDMSAQLERLRRVRDRFDDRPTSLWITEVGVGGAPGPPRVASVGLDRQGPVLVRMYRAAQRSDVEAFVIYALRDSPAEGPKFEPFGVVGGDLRPKPAYCHLASRLGGVPACG